MSLKEENLDAWPNSRGRTFDELDALLEDKAMAYDEHKIAL